MKLEDFGALIKANELFDLVAQDIKTLEKHLHAEGSQNNNSPQPIRLLQISRKALGAEAKKNIPNFL